MDRILKQYKALPTPVAHETLDAFAAQATMDHKARLQVRHYSLIPYITESLALQYAEAVSLWMKQQDENKRALLEDAKKQCFETCVRLDDRGERSVLISLLY